jgi:hypothetical protein
VRISSQHLVAWAQLSLRRLRHRHPARRSAYRPYGAARRRKGSALAPAGRGGQYYAVNLIWNPAGSLNVGIEGLYGRYKTFDGNRASDARPDERQYDFIR